MNYQKAVWVLGVAIVASVLDLVYMFWTRSNPGHNFHRAAWKAGSMGKGKYDLIKLGHIYTNQK